LKPAVLLVAADGFARPAEAGTTNGNEPDSDSLWSHLQAEIPRSEERDSVVDGSPAHRGRFALPDPEGAILLPQKTQKSTKIHPWPPFLCLLVFFVANLLRLLPSKPE
jgi:hypothetical protein